MITSQVLRLVQECPLVVADLTGHNPNVLYELAVRHAIEKPIIHVIEPKLSKIPFDIAGFRTIEFDLTDPDSIESAVEQLKRQTEQAENGKWGETPVKLANIMRRSKEDSKDTVLLKQVVVEIAKIRAQLSERQTFPVTAIPANSLGRYSIVPEFEPVSNKLMFVRGVGTPEFHVIGEAVPGQANAAPPEHQPDAAAQGRKAEAIKKVKDSKKSNET